MEKPVSLHRWARPADPVFEIRWMGGSTRHGEIGHPPSVGPTRRSSIGDPVDGRIKSAHGEFGQPPSAGSTRRSSLRRPVDGRIKSAHGEIGRTPSVGSTRRSSLCNPMDGRIKSAGWRIPRTSSVRDPPACSWRSTASFRAALRPRLRSGARRCCGGCL